MRFNKIVLAGLCLLPAFHLHPTPAEQKATTLVLDDTTLRTSESEDNLDLLAIRNEQEKSVSAWYPKLQIKADTQTLLKHATYPLINHFSPRGMVLASAEAPLGFATSLTLPPDVLDLAWPDSDAADTLYLAIWIDPESQTETHAASLFYSHKRLGTYAKHLDVPADSLPSGVEKPRGFPIAVAVSNGTLLEPAIKLDTVDPTDPKSLRLALTVAVQNGNVEQLDSIVTAFAHQETPFSPDLRDELAALAAACNRVEVLDYLIEAGSDIQKPHFSGPRWSHYNYKSKGNTLKTPPEVAFDRENRMEPPYYYWTPSQSPGSMRAPQNVNNLIFRAIDFRSSAAVLTLLEELDHQPKRTIRNQVVRRALESGDLILARALLDLGYPYNPESLDQKRSHAEICKEAGAQKLLAMIE